MRSLFITLLLLALVLPIMAQSSLPRPNFSPYTSSGSSLLSMENLSMSHSMGFQAGTSSVGDGYYLSRYTNHIMYKFNPKLELDLDLSLVNFGSMNTGSKIEFNDDNSSKIIPEFSLRYKPSDNVFIQVQMTRGNLYNPSRYNWYNNR